MKPLAAAAVPPSWPPAPAAVPAYVPLVVAAVVAGAAVAVVALAGNVANGLDVCPGRAAKAFLVVGAVLAETLPAGGRGAALLVLAGLQLLAETVSFSVLIGWSPLLHPLDLLG